jgi:hypothetical protein
MDDGEWIPMPIVLNPEPLKKIAIAPKELF